MSSFITKLPGMYNAVKGAFNTGKSIFNGVVGALGGGQQRIAAPQQSFQDAAGGLYNNARSIPGGLQGIYNSGQGMYGDARQDIGNVMGSIRSGNYADALGQATAGINRFTNNASRVAQQVGGVYNTGRDMYNQAQYVGGQIADAGRSIAESMRSRILNRGRVGGR